MNEVAGRGWPEPHLEPPLAGMVLVVDIVLARRNERQRMVLVVEHGGWAIAGTAAASTVKPAIAYGTPVFEEPEE